MEQHFSITTLLVLLSINQALARNLEITRSDPVPQSTPTPSQISVGPSPEPQSSSQVSSVDAGTRAGVAIGCLFGVCLFAGLIFFIMKRRKQWLAGRVNDRRVRELQIADIIRSRTVQSQALAQPSPVLEKQNLHPPLPEQSGLEITRVELEGTKLPGWEYTRGHEVREDGSF
ncbi:uncharacterized protein MYCFIDRAFT_195153 [Pseudocercospora fijiensis CIRAD86]|uniref:Uncharacterized protein n=1 Tax=Pseudocercospora fijiensis (strain CIRAD86) TaxID=383855 RepID=M3B3K5_PSEFD|nr:uncharacterized protein MYCFIDRAFT_195153 [Pseudocercospora fijiensis CIRAD86]EME83968.1 hypothetical protein MYCFIDRAFT_195153 [Pseudocercospora fijiensis CIRAD86]